MQLINKLFGQEKPPMPPRYAIIKWAAQSDGMLITEVNAHKWKRIIGMDYGEPLASPLCREGIAHSEKEVQRLQAKGFVIFDATFGLDQPLNQRDPTGFVAVQTGSFTVPKRVLKAKV